MTDRIRIRQEGATVLFIKNDRLVASLPWDAAVEIGRNLMAVGHKAEEWAKAESIVHDHAILARVGVPLGLTSHPTLLREVRKEAAHNRDLRRYLPGGVKSEELVLAPALIQHAPRTGATDEQG